MGFQDHELNIGFPSSNEISSGRTEKKLKDSDEVAIWKPLQHRIASLTLGIIEEINIHRWTPGGYESVASYPDFWDWVKSVIDDIAEWVRLDRDRIIEALRDLSDRELQRQFWVSTGYPLVDRSRGVFTDTGLSPALEKGRTGFGRKIDSLLLELDKRLSEIDSDQYHEQLIDDPKMIKIRELATTVISLLNRLAERECRGNEGA